MQSPDALITLTSFGVDDIGSFVRLLLLMDKEKG